MWGTAPGLIALLTEKNQKFQIKGITELENVVSSEWPQISESIELITKLALDKDFPACEIAARLASKLYYNLGEHDKAVDFAILSGKAFDVTVKDEFTQSVSAHCIQCYIKRKKESQEIDPKLTEIVKSVLTNLLKDERYSACLCLAIETDFLDFVQESLEKQPDLVEAAIEITLSTVTDIDYTQKLLSLLVTFADKNCDKFQVAQLYHSLHNPESIAQVLIALRKSNNTDNWLMAYQIAFELAENANQNFRQIIIEMLPPDMADLMCILTRKMLLKFYLDFLFNNNHTDIHIIVNLKESLKTKKMLILSSVVCSYSFMYAGTGDDNFYRQNIDWFSNGKKWTQFMTIAGVGAIHIGHLSSALAILGPFLQKGTPAYAYGGGLYALGLIYANYSWNEDVINAVTMAVTNIKNPVVKHGACLALGLIAMGSHKIEYATMVRDVLNEDDEPEPGEAAGYAYGMIMLGVGECEELEELMSFAEQCEHEKVTRGLAMSFAFMMYGRQDHAEPTIQKLLASKKPLMRESAAWVIALAYVGTASNVALERLLHLAVSDVNSDVRRAAVIGVGFVLSRSPHEVPGMLDLLAKSYHPHVRSGAALAVGIACAGTGMPEAIAILQPLLDDLEDFVKQSAMIAMAMVLQQQSDAAVPYAKDFRQYLRKLVTKDRSEIQAYGVSLAYGILNAGGRNVALSCNSLRGENSTLATVGIALFCNYFYWLPLTLMLPLAFHPTAVIGLDKNLDVVPWEIYCSKPASMFAYPPDFVSEGEQAKEKEAVQLSISKKPEKKDVVIPAPTPVEEEKVDESDFVILKNQSRVTLNQLQYLDFNYCEKYTPITGEVFHGFVMLRTNETEEEDDDDDALD